MIPRLSWYVGTLFLVAAIGALINPPFYIAIAVLFLLMGLVLLPPTNELSQRYLNWQIRGGTKGTVILVSFVVLCLIVPQVETDPAKFTHRPIMKKLISN